MWRGANTRFGYGTRRRRYKKGLYIHCVSHKLNLVVNDLNNVPEISNCIGTVKDTISFFRESASRRKYTPTFPLLCETRWSQKHKRISVFKKHFIEIVKGLEKLSKEGNTPGQEKWLFNCYLQLNKLHSYFFMHYRQVLLPAGTSGEHIAV